VHDQAALRQAVDLAHEVVPLFVLDEGLRRHRRSSARDAFLSESLADLRAALRRLGGDLVVRRGDPVEETLRLATQTGSEAVFVGADASGYARQREERLRRACLGERVRLRIENTIAAVPAGELVPADRDHYRVFTAYWRRWRQQPLSDPLEPPRRVVVPAGIATGELPLPRGGTAGGEQAARRRLRAWLRDGLYRYDTDRNDLAVDGTSRLSPYLHFGCVSAAEVVMRARGHGGVAVEFLRQLCWRDFYLQLLSANPQTVTRDLRPRGREWSDDERALAAWTDGRTGYPIVDAAMRQLRDEGWIHNRARLLAGAFLTKTLGVHWRCGEEVFFDRLVDGDVANNAGNWQWVAGTGVDTRPNRRFNPVAQARRLDPDGVYVRRHVPELETLAGALIHEPWHAGRAVPPDYPDRIVV
jgi:deoxyribodipyrimidine photo-lyase